MSLPSFRWLLYSLIFCILFLAASPSMRAAEENTPKVWGPQYTFKFTDTVLDVAYIPESKTIMSHYLVAAGSAGLLSVDASEPNSPISFNTNGTALDLYVSQPYVFVAAGNRGVQIVNLEDPFNAQQIDTPGYALDVFAQYPLVFVADGSAGLTILDYSLESPEIIQTFDTPGYAHAVEVHDGYAYIADGQAGMVIVNLTDPGNATHMGSCGAIGTCGDPTQFKDLTVRDNIAYVADGDGSLQIFDVSNKSNPVILDWIDLDGVLDSILLHNDTIFVTAGDDGLWEVEWEDHENLTLVSHSLLPGQARGLAMLDSGHLLVAAEEAGLLVLEKMPDSDGDGTGDPLDAYPDHPWYSRDSDFDGFPDEVNKGAHATSDHAMLDFIRVDDLPDERDASLDTDRDGFPDEYNFEGLKSNLRLDDFPDDPAASKDSDGDGYPDEWNEGYHQKDSTTGLELDVNAGNANFAKTVDIVVLVVLFGALVGMVIAVRGYGRP